MINNPTKNNVIQRSNVSDGLQSSYTEIHIPITKNSTIGIIISFNILSSSPNGRIKIIHFGNLDLVIIFMILLYFLFNFLFYAIFENLSKKKITKLGYFKFIIIYVRNINSGAGYGIRTHDPLDHNQML